MIGKLLKRAELKFIKKHKGYPIFYIIYTPTKEVPNVFTLSAIPEMQKDVVIDGLCKEIADEVRRWYKDNPKELERVKELIIEAEKGVK